MITLSFGMQASIKSRISVLGLRNITGILEAMKILHPCLCIIVYILTTCLYLAPPSQCFPADIVQLPFTTSWRTINGSLRCRRPTPARLDHRSFSTHLRRGIDGYLTISPAIGSFQLQTKHFIAFTTIIPATLAAIYLGDFLDTIALRIETGFWSEEAPTNHRVIHMWSFELAFYSQNTAIPWDFIQEYVLVLADEIAKGFVATFEQQLTGLIGGVATEVTVKLRINSPHPPMAPPR